MSLHKAVGAAVIVVVIAVTKSHALNVVVDFTYDTFFISNPTAMAAINAAASDISAAILTTLNPMQDSVSATYGGSLATFAASLSFENPATGLPATIVNAAMPADEVRIFMAGHTSSHAVPGSINIFPSSPYTFSNASEFAVAVDIAEAAAEENFGRGGGPTRSTRSGSYATTFYSIDYGIAVGSFMLYTGTNWHYDHTTAVAPGKMDLYSTALHEMLHVLGYGGGIQSWGDNVSPSDPTDWLGPNVIALLGTGDGAISSTYAHIGSGISSSRPSDGVPEQEPVMYAGPGSGRRKYMTALDLAFLRDLGWETIDWATPLISGDLDGDNDVDFDDWLIVLNYYGTTSGATRPTGDNDGDTDVDINDYNAVMNNYGYGTGGGGAFVPEPATVTLLGLCAFPLIARRRPVH